MTPDQYDLDFGKLMKYVSAEAREVLEWICYDDDYLRPIPGNWAEIVEGMSKHGAYPTILIYERLFKSDQHEFGKSFQI